MKLLTAEQVGSEAGTSAERVRQMRRSGEIKAEKVGTIWLFDPRVVDYIRNKPETRGRKKAFMGEKAVN